MASDSANCTKQDNTDILRVTAADLEIDVESDVIEELDQLIEEPESDSNTFKTMGEINFGHDSSNTTLFWSDYKNNIIPYIAGSIVRGLIKKYTNKKY